MSFVSLAAIPLPSRLFLADGYDRRDLEMVAMGCRSLDFAAVEADLGFAAIASGSGLRGGLRRSSSRLTLGRAPAPRTGVAHMIVMICGGFAVDCGGFDCVGCGGFD
uniref:Uncharacterized protein n=1 Tax=Fagus sylvatica TaxID=28930 RepID=A0A2N9EZM5_FAGSY